MTKSHLLLAASVAAITMAGTAAIAGPITGTGTFSGSSSTATAGALKLASELRFSASATTATAFAATQGSLTYNFLPSAAGAFPAGESLLLTLDVDGAVFTGAVGASVVATNPTACSVSVSTVDAPEANEDEARYLVSFGSNCSTAAPADAGLAVSLPIQVTGANDVTAGALLQSSFGGQTLDVDGGKTTALFIDSTDAFVATVTASGGNVATANVVGGYQSFVTNDVSVATVSFAVTSGVQTAISTTATASASDIANVRIVATAAPGNTFSGFNLEATPGAGPTSGTGVRFSATTATAQASTVRQITYTGGDAVVAGVITVSVLDNTATATGAGVTTADLNGRIDETSVTLTASVDLLANDSFGSSTGKFVDFSESQGPVQIVNRNGASFVAPWFALSGATNTSTLRISNNSQNEDTGLIRVRLLSDNGTGTPTTREIVIDPADLQAGTLTASNGIAAQKTVSITGASLAAAFGTDARNGDIEVSIEAQSGQVSGKVRVIQASGNVFESSLGEIDSTP